MNKKMRIIKTFKKVFWNVLSLNFLFIFFVNKTLAASTPGSGTVTGTPGSGATQSTPGSSSMKLENPLESDDILQFLGAIFDIIITFAIPIIVLYIMYAGFMLVTARGDTTKIATGKTALTWAIIGGILILGADLLITVIDSTVDSI